MFEFYDSPAQMEPLVVESSRPVYMELLGVAHELCEVSARLETSLSPTTAASMAELVAGMNCYYSNLIEGHHTRPFEIEKALQQARLDPEQHRLPSLADAHLEASQWAQQQPLTPGTMIQFLAELHSRFCARLPQELLKLEDGTYVVPGQFRSRNVHVGIHVPPKHEVLQLFLERFAKTYEQRLIWAKESPAGKLNGVIATFAAHHRLVWIHPFLDGNGRVARIVLEAMLRVCGVNSARLWSVSRGFAKSSEEYKLRLANADQPRMGDLDGRGNLSEKRLVEFCTYAMQTAIDQARFMSRMFALEEFKDRAHAYFQRVRFDLKPESVHLYLHAFVFGSFERMEAGRITGLPERTARDVLNALVKEGFLMSDTPKGKVRVGFPLHAAGSLLPNLYPAGDLDVDPAPGKESKRRYGR